MKDPKHWMSEIIIKMIENTEYFKRIRDFRAEEKSGMLCLYGTTGCYYDSQLVEKAILKTSKIPINSFIHVEGFED